MYIYSQIFYRRAMHLSLLLCYVTLHCYYFFLICEILQMIEINSNSMVIVYFECKLDLSECQVKFVNCSSADAVVYGTTKA